MLIAVPFRQIAHPIGSIKYLNADVARRDIDSESKRASKRYLIATFLQERSRLSSPPNNVDRLARERVNGLRIVRRRAMLGVVL
jgi:hypothetical protein